MKNMGKTHFCTICKKREDLLNIQDKYKEQYIRDEMYEYFGEMASMIKETDYFCTSCITSIRKFNKIKFDLVRVAIYRSGDSYQLENIRLPLLNSANDDMKNDDRCDNEILEIFQVEEVKRGPGRPKKRSHTALSMPDPALAVVEDTNTNNRPKSALLETQSEYECGIDGCKMMYHELKFMSYHKQRKHKLIPYLYPCTECNAKFENRNFLDIHLTTEHLEQRICPMCLQKFLGIISLNKHIVTAHLKKRRPKKKKQATKSIILEVVS